jgi:hypothetical protein
LAALYPLQINQDETSNIKTPVNRYRLLGAGLMP